MKRIESTEVVRVRRVPRAVEVIELPVEGTDLTRCYVVDYSDATDPLGRVFVPSPRALADADDETMDLNEKTRVDAPDQKVTEVDIDTGPIRLALIRAALRST